jgi:hypothetical protein
MYAQLTESLYIYGPGEHGERVELPLVNTPIITVPPSYGESPDVWERSTVGPFGIAYFVWKSRVIELSLEKGKCLL